MFVDNEKRVIIYHVPKTGGTTLHHALEHAYEGGIFLTSGKEGRDYLVRDLNNPDRLIKHTVANPNGVKSPAHFDPSALQKHSTPSDCHKFWGNEITSFRACAVFRNPYDRALSAYKFKVSEAIRLNRDRNKFLANGEPISFQYFLESGLSTKVLAGKPQQVWIDDNALSFAALKLENLDSSAGHIGNLLEMSREAVSRFKNQLQKKLNQSKNYVGDQTITAECRRLIEKIYAHDFSRLHY